MEIRESTPPRGVVRRLGGALFRQAARTQRCPDTPRLDGQLAVVTGATGGIGLEIARGLVARGADLIVPCRNLAKGTRVVDALRSEARDDARIEATAMDLEDLDSVRAGARAIAELADGRAIDILVENAGVWPRRYAQTAQGHELAFGVNVLSHFVLGFELSRDGVLETARVVIVTGDIYITERECTPDFQWRGARGGMRAYSRSKLGNLWIGAHLARHTPSLTVHTAHPGVVATNLGGGAGPFADWLRGRLMISPQLGAQMPLICATQAGLEDGGYYHNTLGRVRLRDDDPARDAAAAAKLWDTCVNLSGANRVD